MKYSEFKQLVREEIQNNLNKSYNFSNEDSNKLSETEMIEDIVEYFIYERDERPKEMLDPNWWGDDIPFDGMSRDEITLLAKNIVQSKEFQNPKYQKNFDTHIDWAWELYNNLYL